MAYRFFQSVIVQMKNATDREIGVLDDGGLVLASSELSLIGRRTGVPDADTAEGETFVQDGRTFRKVTGRDSRTVYRVYVDGTDEIARSLCVMASVAIYEAILRYEEKYDKSTLVKNIITDNILPSDTYAHAKELDFSEDTSRGVFLIRSAERSEGLLEAVQAVFPDKYRDFVLSMTETDVVLIKEIQASAET
ncbi:MAG: PucR family transcriptional regulator, partial [Oscillospiraceae bacterium]|nr:PucR family transcriptional regulator [Oscillospiraceae bacterium]